MSFNSSSTSGNLKSLNSTGKNARSNTPGGTRVSSGVAGVSSDLKSRVKTKTTYFQQGTGGKKDLTGVARFGDNCGTSSSSSSSTSPKSTSPKNINNSNNSSNNTYSPNSRGLPPPPRNTTYTSAPFTSQFALPPPPPRLNIPRPQTVSIAIPSSMLNGYGTKELKSFVVGNIARLVGVFEIDEIVIYDDLTKITNTTTQNDNIDSITGVLPDTNSNSDKNPLLFLQRLLSYAETPPYLKRRLFPQHGDLSSSGVLSPLDTPAHMRLGEESLYREGIVLNKWTKTGMSYVFCGTKNDIAIDIKAPVNSRVTIRLTSYKDSTGVCVSPDEPREAAGIYWGYKVRVVGPKSQSAGGVLERVLQTGEDYEYEYDLKIGVSSSLGSNDLDVLDTEIESERDGSAKKKVNGILHGMKNFNHAILVFSSTHSGGLEGLIDSDQSTNIQSNEVSTLFDHYVNCLRWCGVKSMRVEEELSVLMSRLRGGFVNEFSRRFLQDNQGKKVEITGDDLKRAREGGNDNGKKKKARAEIVKTAEIVFSDGSVSDESSDEEEEEEE